MAKAYRLLKAILQTAVDDELIRRNPCRIKGAGNERSPERPTVTIEQVYAIAERCPAVVQGAGAAGGVHRPAVGRADRSSAGVTSISTMRCREGAWLGGRRSTASSSRARPSRRPGAGRWRSPTAIAARAASASRRRWSQAGRRRPGVRRADRVRRLGGPTSRPTWRSKAVGGRRAGAALPRPAPHRQHAGGRGRQPPGADGEDGPRSDAGGADLPARHEDRERAIAAAISARIEAASEGSEGTREGHGEPDRTPARRRATAKAPLTWGRGAESG